MTTSKFSTLGARSIAFRWTRYVSNDFLSRKSHSYFLWYFSHFVHSLTCVCKFTGRDVSIDIQQQNVFWIVTIRDTESDVYKHTCMMWNVFNYITFTRVTLTVWFILPQKSGNLKKYSWLVGHFGHALSTEFTRCAKISLFSTVKSNRVKLSSNVTLVTTELPFKNWQYIRKQSCPMWPHK